MKNELAAIYTLWLREIKRFYRQRSRVLGVIMQPLLFLFLIGTGLANSIAASAPYDYTKFMYPGIICMTLLFTSVFSGLSIVRDREFGFLKEVMIAPISRISIALGKTFGGGSVAVLQGALLLLLSPLLGITLTPVVVMKLLLLMSLIAFSLTSLGILIAVPMESMEGFQMVMNFLVMPMFFLSGAFFPMEGLPEWMNFLMMINPLTYAVDAFRNVIFSGKIAGMMVNNSLSFDIIILFVIGVCLNILAVYAFKMKKQ